MPNQYTGVDESRRHKWFDTSARQLLVKYRGYSHARLKCISDKFIVSDKYLID